MHISKMGQGVFLFLFRLCRQPIIGLWLFAICRTPYYPTYMTNNRWRSVDAYFQHGAGSVSLSRLAILTADNMLLTVCNLSHPKLPNINDQESLTLHWNSFWRSGREGIAICFAYKGGQWFLYDCLQPIGGVNTQDAWPIIIDAPLTLIFKMM